MSPQRQWPPADATTLTDADLDAAPLAVRGLIDRPMTVRDYLAIQSAQHQPRAGAPPGEGLTAERVLSEISARWRPGDPPPTQADVAGGLGVTDRYLRRVCRSRGGWRAMLDEVATLR